MASSGVPTTIASSRRMLTTGWLFDDTIIVVVRCSIESTSLRRTECNAETTASASQCDEMIRVGRARTRVRAAPQTLPSRSRRRLDVAEPEPALDQHAAEHERVRADP